jgi:Na+-transporting methylmalonyl-CoA/oxaloacetate decarboxylase gamma subunit
MKLVGDGFVLFVLGQAVVFLFIGLKVLFINVSAFCVKRFLTTGDEEVLQDTDIDAVEDEGPAIAAAVVAVEQLRANS